MNKKTRRTTANLPVDLLEQAMKSTGLGITETLTEGLRLVRRSRAAKLAEELKGKLDFDFDPKISRERTHR